MDATMPNTTEPINSRFSIIENPEGTYRIECMFIVYRQKFGHHPDFLPQDEEKGAREGFNTKFWFLVDDDLTKNNAEKTVEEYQQKYDVEIRKIENDDTLWDTFPFKNNIVIYAK